MIGLPGDTCELDLYSARETVTISPSIARLYPTVVIPDTELHKMFCRAGIAPMQQEDAIRTYCGYVQNPRLCRNKHHTGRFKVQRYHKWEKYAGRYLSPRFPSTG